LAFVAPSVKPMHGRRVAARMDASESSAQQLAEPELGALDGVVVPTGAAPSDSMVTTSADQSEPKALLLQRYLQLRTVLPDATALDDATVESLIVQAEEEADGSLQIDERLAGEWRQVWQRTAKEGTASQKALSPVSQKLYQNFIVDADGETIFRNVVQVTKKRIGVIFDVKYEAADAAREPPNRLPSTIKTARMEVKLGRRFGWKPLRIPLPLKGEGWLDVTYLSDELRITRGNRGGVFVHMREALLTREAAEATRPAS